MPFISLCQANDLIQSINRYVQTIMFIEYNIYIIFLSLKVLTICISHNSKANHIYNKINYYNIKSLLFF